MKTNKIKIGGGVLMGLALSFGDLPPAAAQNPFAAPTQALDTLSEAPVAGGNAAMAKAQAVAPPGGAPPAGAPGAPPPPPGAPPPPGNAAAAFKGQFGASAAGALKEAKEAARKVINREVKAVVGTRVFDAVTGELIDDAQLRKFTEEDKSRLGLVDDGTKGDLTPEDGMFANIEVSRDYIGQSNQRLKERLIQAISSAEQLDPLEFYGFHLMTTERNKPVPRGMKWSLVPGEKGVGMKLAEVASEKPHPVPGYREWEQEKDKKIAGKDGWAIRFLDEYRKEKGDLASEFYPIYVPAPPVPPTIPPPDHPDWKPFPKPEGPKEPQGGGPVVVGTPSYQGLEGVEGVGGGGTYMNLGQLRKKGIGGNLGDAARSKVKKRR